MDRSSVGDYQRCLATTGMAPEDLEPPTVPRSSLEESSRRGGVLWSCFQRRRRLFRKTSARSRQRWRGAVAFVAFVSGAPRMPPVAATAPECRPICAPFSAELGGGSGGAAEGIVAPRVPTPLHQPPNSADRTRHELRSWRRRRHSEGGGNSGPLCAGVACPASPAYTVT